ncbi:threonine/serine exporter family protein [Sulfobacillus thermosulfidooxidans]|uniref:threonine/serine exporter family protein n=1 Tax=Sulfobacillus thermosulfidooxidans TaxID=28034 RepID=UPI0009DF9195|nr:threonine/serine exporter family protein [Sulfobacillus thermosulfidooxidans]
MTKSTTRLPGPQPAPLDALEAVVEAGLAMLTSGAEVSRVEDTMVRLAQAYRIEPVDVVAMPTALFVAGPDGRSLVKRVRRRSVNLAVVAEINQLSRDVAKNPIPLNEFREQLEKAKQRAIYPPWSSILFAAGAAGLISQLMGGHLVDVLPAAVSGGLTQLTRRTLFKTQIPGSLSDLLSAAVATLPALFLARFHTFQLDAILVGGIMVLTPGLLFTTAVRDGITGDLVSAVSRLLEALLIGGAVAAGASLPLYIYLHLGGRWP